MRSKRVIRYYCDHCSKGFFKRPSCARHEKYCLRNHTRSCYMCDGAPNMFALTAIIDNPDEYGEDAALAELRETADGCPACILAAILQSDNRNLPYGDRWTFDNFDYKAEANEYLHPRPGGEDDDTIEW